MLPAPVTPILVAQGSALNAPRGLTLNPINGDLLTANEAVNNNLVELTTSGTVIGVRSLDPGGAAGALFGLAETTNANGQLVIYYDDSNTSKLNNLAGGIPGYAGYQMVGANGSSLNFGASTNTGGMGAYTLTSKVVGIANASGGYLMATANGMVYAFGGAHAYGNVASLHLNAPIVGIVATPTGGGYWLVAADGGVFNFGSAGYYGNTYALGLTGLTGSHPLNKPVVSIIPTEADAGYWMIAADGGVFNFGDAMFAGSTYSEGLTLGTSIVGATPSDLISPIGSYRDNPPNTNAGLENPAFVVPVRPPLKNTSPRATCFTRTASRPIQLKVPMK
ncbi:MAG: hypothetical protein ACYDHP_02600 [Ferrimicrobium sp.]